MKNTFVNNTAKILFALLLTVAFKGNSSNAIMKHNDPSENNLKKEVSNYRIEQKQIDNLSLISIDFESIPEKTEYLILDSRGTVLGGGVINKNRTHIALKNFPEGEYTLKIKARNAGLNDKVVINIQP